MMVWVYQERDTWFEGVYANLDAVERVGLLARHGVTAADIVTNEDGSRGFVLVEAVLCEVEVEE